MEKGDWVKIDFTGMVKTTGEIFDLTSAEEAKKHGIFDPKKKYGPMLAILGAGMMMPGVEHQLMGMKHGDSAEFDVKPDKAMGPRRPELIKLFSMAKFMHEKITPFPGMWVNIDGRNAKVQSVAGGRVRVDFNHPLAGKELSYSVKIVEELKEPKMRTESLLDYYGVDGKAEIMEKNVDIQVEKDANPIIRKLIEETLKMWCGGIESVTFHAKTDKTAQEKTAAEKPRDDKA